IRNNPAGPLTNPETQRSILSSAAAGSVFAIVVGIIMISTEFRHFTSRPTFLLEPRRGRVIVAKLLVAGGLGIVYGLACVAAVFALTGPGLGGEGVSLGWASNGLIATMLGILFVVAIYAVVGIGVGVLFRNQIAAVISALVFLFVIEPLIAAIPGVKEAYPYFPAAAAMALTGTMRDQQVLLAQWQGGLLLFGYGLLFALLGWILTL